MFDQTRSGYILPDDFNVVSTVFEKVVAARNIDRHSDEAECLARQALSLFMNGNRDAWELERRLRDYCASVGNVSGGAGGTEVIDLLPELSAWARNLTVSPEAATALTERTLEYAIDHMSEFVETSDIRGWLLRSMVELRLGRGRRTRSGKPFGGTDGL
ncbi:hypothetical protein [Ensifer sp. OV372]|uniref:hypothetical protein n=1 Tax=Ensifer sp. OV372 TaxID=1855293 RepID=UPI0008E1744C|nr:hypothetical protein [Ensifer sp. OV372]SFH27245.1 hypothetical protein SAMN05216459_1235 [Ensifer sp. OV372]